MDRSRIICRAALLAVLAIPVAGQAFAQSDICARLEARLTALDSRAGIGDFDKTQALEKSIRDQREKLDRAREDARRAGCTGIFQRLRAQGSCGPLMASVNRMRANLNRLTASRDRDQGDRFGGSERRELVRALAANQCGGHYQDYDRPARRGGFFAGLFGRHFRDRGWGGNFFGDGTFRTLCVRTCDGYYFPISFTTVQSRFTRDEQRCRSMCPGTEVALYVHRNPGEESEAMISLAGEPYVALPTAFRYRREYDPACKCGQIAAAALSPAGASNAVGNLSAYGTVDDPWGFARGAETAEPSRGDAPVPTSRPPTSEDPETLANRSGGLAPEPVAPPVSAVVGLTADGEKHVRIVGPTYFYSQ